MQKNAKKCKRVRKNVKRKRIGDREKWGSGLRTTASLRRQMNLASVLNRNEKAPGGSDVWQRKGLFSSFFEVWQAQDLAAFFWMCGKERS